MKGFGSAVVKLRIPILIIAVLLLRPREPRNNAA